MGASRARAITSGPPVLVALFLRGAADGLNLVVPHGDDHYYDLRPNLQVPPGTEIDLDGFYGLHPSMTPILPLYQNGDLAIVHAAGSHHESRSHFDAQDFMEKAAPGDKSVINGWLNRMLAELGGSESWQGITLDKATSLALAGDSPKLAFSSIEGFALNADPEVEDVIRSLQTMPGIPSQDLDAIAKDLNLNPVQTFFLEDLAAQGWVGPVPHEAPALEDASGDAFEALAEIGNVPTDTSVVYPPGNLAATLRDTAALVKADIGVRTIAINRGGWDHHSDGSGQTSTLAGDLAASLAAFYEDLGLAAARTCTLVMTEFGRTACENGSLGSDHGHGGVMLALGGSVQGGRVITDGGFPGLGPSELYEGRDLAVTTDFRDVFADVAVNFMGLGETSLDLILPDFSASPAKRPGLFL